MTKERLKNGMEMRLNSDIIQGWLKMAIDYTSKFGE